MKLKSSIEEILGEEQQQEWTVEQMQVPQQTEKESCGYRMLYNLNKICSQKNTEIIEDEELALAGYTLEIIKILKRRQQDNAREKDIREETRTREEREKETRTEENKAREELGGPKAEQDLEKREREMNEKIIENRRKLAKKRKEREENEEENKHKKK